MLKEYIVAFAAFMFTYEVVDSTNYKAGVVEYHFVDKADASPHEILNRNVQEYIKILKNFTMTRPEIQEGILVFPECGLISLIGEDNPISVKVPSPSTEQKDFTGLKVIEELASAADEYNTWIVVNLVESDRDKMYNTDVVFRNNGTIAAKYRKFNLFGEPVNRPEEAVAVSFKTNFNVEFGVFTCFDILFRHPALDLVDKGVRHFVFPTAWFSELPFLTAIEYQKSWSWANNATLLAAGLGNASYGSTGSGIYCGQSGHDITYQTVQSDNSKLIVAVLNTENEDFQPVDLKEDLTDGQLKLKQESLDAYTTKTIQPDDCTPQRDLVPGQIVECSKQILQTLCNNQICCSFNLSAVFILYVCQDDSCEDAINLIPHDISQDDFSYSVYRMAAFDGVRSFDVTTGGVQTCAVVSCRNDSISSCGLSPASRPFECFHLSSNRMRVCTLQRYIENGTIEGRFLKENTFISPILFLKSNTSSKFGTVSNNFVFKDGETGASLDFLAKGDALGTAAIWSRVFVRDGQPATKASSESASLSVIIGFAALLVYPTIKFLTM